MLTTKRAAKRLSTRSISVGASKRQIGRPDSSTESVGPEALIAKTCELLTQMSPSKVTRAEVARHAGVDPSLIRYYFQNRTSLLVAAAESIMLEFDATFEHELQRTGTTSAGKLQARMGALLDLIVTHPFYHRLLTEELFVSDSPAAAKLLEKLAHRGQIGYEKIIEEGVEDGTLRDVNGAFLLIAVIGMCDAFVTLAPVLDIALGKTAAPQARRRQYEEFISELVIYGVRVPDKEERSAVKRKK